MSKFTIYACVILFVLTVETFGASNAGPRERCRSKLLSWRRDVVSEMRESKNEVKSASETASSRCVSLFKDLKARLKQAISAIQVYSTKSLKHAQGTFDYVTERAPKEDVQKCTKFLTTVEEATAEAKASVDKCAQTELNALKNDCLKIRDAENSHYKQYNASRITVDCDIGNIKSFDSCLAAAFCLGNAKGSAKSNGEVIAELKSIIAKVESSYPKDNEQVLTCIGKANSTSNLDKLLESFENDVRSCLTPPASENNVGDNGKANNQDAEILGEK